MESVIQLCVQENEEVDFGEEPAVPAVGTDHVLEAVGRFWLVPIHKSMVGTQIRSYVSLCYLGLHKTR